MWVKRVLVIMSAEQTDFSPPRGLVKVSWLLTYSALAKVEPRWSLRGGGMAPNRKRAAQALQSPKALCPVIGSLRFESVH